MIEWKATQLAWTRKFATMSLHFDWAEKKMDRWNWGEVSQHEFKGVERRRERERDEKRVEESQEDVHRNENRWKEMTRGEKSLEELRCGFTICNKRSEVPEKSMEVCRSSYTQTLFLDPIALHFLNLETSATRLARVLLVMFFFAVFYPQHI